MTREQDWLASLEILRRRETKAQDLQETRSADLHIAVAEAMAQGVKGPEIAARLGLTRVRIYQMRDHGNWLISRRSQPSLGDIAAGPGVPEPIPSPESVALAADSAST